MAFHYAVGVLTLALFSRAEPFNTFDGPGHPACNNVAQVHNATSVEEMQDIVRDAAKSNTPIRASGKGHMCTIPPSANKLCLRIREIVVEPSMVT